MFGGGRKYVNNLGFTNTTWEKCFLSTKQAISLLGFMICLGLLRAFTNSSDRPVPPEHPRSRDPARGGDFDLIPLLGGVSRSGGVGECQKFHIEPLTPSFA